MDRPLVRVMDVPLVRVMDVRTQMFVFPKFREPTRSFNLGTSARMTQDVHLDIWARNLSLWAAFLCLICDRQGPKGFPLPIPSQIMLFLQI